MTAAEAGRSIVDGLDEAIRRFADGDAVAASAALDAVTATCAALESAHVRLDPQTLALARARHAACDAAARAASARLSAEMQAAGAARRAVGAYRR